MSNSHDGTQVMRGARATIAAAALGVLAGAASAGVAAADNPGDEAGAAQMDEVIVTARRVEENIQRVPIAVSAYSPETLAKLDTRDIISLAKTLPGVQICCTAFNTGLTYIRGLRGGPTYFGGAPVSSTGYSNFFDISSVQVLKGPQGTLFGQASAAGAFVYEPHRPGTELGGYVRLSAGDYSRRTAEGAIDIPLAGDRLLVRLAAKSAFVDGYIHDLSNNKNYGDQNYRILRPSVTWRISEKLENNVLYQYSHARDNGFGGGLWPVQDLNFNTSRTSTVARTAMLNGGNLAAYYALAAEMLALQMRLGPYTVIGTPVGCANGQTGSTPNPTFVSSLAPSGRACPQGQYRDQLLINTTTYDFNDRWTLKNIVGLNKSETFQQPGGILAPLIWFTSGNPKNVNFIPGPRRWSEELQVHGTAGRMDITAGTFHTRQYNRPVIVYSQFNVAESAARTASESNSHAVYAQTNINLDNLLQGLTVTLGGRYNRDYIGQTSDVINPANDQVLGRSVSKDDPAGHATFSNFSYTAGLQYQATPETMFFLTNSRAVSAGGFQNTAGIGQFKPETLNNLELGVKSTFDIGSVRTRVNASAYYGWFDDVQVNIWSTVTLPITGIRQAAFFVENAATATVRGFDGEFTIVPFRNLELGGTVTYSDNVYTKYIGVNQFTGQPIDLSGTPFVKIPKWKYGANATLRLPVPESLGSVSLSANYTHRTFFYNIALPLTPVDPNNPNTGLVCNRQRTAANGYPPLLADGGTAWQNCIPSAEKLDLGAQWRNVMGHEAMSLSLAVSNVTNDTVTDSVVQLDSTVGVTSLQPAPPRMWSVTLNYAF